MKLFRKMFGGKVKESKVDLASYLKEDIEKAQNERILGMQQRHDAAAAQGRLPAPDLGVSYDCECGETRVFHMRNVDLLAGLRVQCATCGAVLFVPPTVFDHSEYDSGLGGASLVTGWREQMRFLKHGRQ